MPREEPAFGVLAGAPGELRGQPGPPGPCCTSLAPRGSPCIPGILGWLDSWMVQVYRRPPSALTQSLGVTRARGSKQCHVGLKKCPESTMAKLSPF